MSLIVLCAAILMTLGVVYASSGDQPHGATKASEVKSGDLRVLVNGFDNDEGHMLIALSNSRADYEGGQGDTVFRGGMAHIADGQSSFVFENIPFGEYAIRMFHDEDNDQELNTNFLGIPTEDYGFSNNASGTFGPPDYDDAKFLFNSDSLLITITID